MCKMRDPHSQIGFVGASPSEIARHELDEPQDGGERKPKSPAKSLAERLSEEWELERGIVEDNIGPISHFNERL